MAIQLKKYSSNNASLNDSISSQRKCLDFASFQFDEPFNIDWAIAENPENPRLKTDYSNSVRVAPSADTSDLFQGSLHFSNYNLNLTQTSDQSFASSNYSFYTAHSQSILSVKQEEVTPVQSSQLNAPMRKNFWRDILASEESIQSERTSKQHTTCSTLSSAANSIKSENINDDLVIDLPRNEFKHLTMMDKEAIVKSELKTEINENLENIASAQVSKSLAITLLLLNQQDKENEPFISVAKTPSDSSRVIIESPFSINNDSESCLISDSEVESEPNAQRLVETQDISEMPESGSAVNSIAEEMDTNSNSNQDEIPTQLNTTVDSNSSSQYQYEDFCTNLKRGYQSTQLTAPQNKKVCVNHDETNESTCTQTSDSVSCMNNDQLNESSVSDTSQPSRMMLFQYAECFFRKWMDKPTVNPKKHAEDNPFFL